MHHQTIPRQLLVRASKASVEPVLEKEKSAREGHTAAVVWNRGRSRPFPRQYDGPVSAGFVHAPRNAPCLARNRPFAYWKIRLLVRLRTRSNVPAAGLISEPGPALAVPTIRPKVQGRSDIQRIFVNRVGFTSITFLASDAARGLTRVTHPALAGQRKPFLPDRWAGDVTAQLLQRATRSPTPERHGRLDRYR